MKHSMLLKIPLKFLLIFWTWLLLSINNKSKVKKIIAKVFLPHRNEVTWNFLAVPQNIYSSSGIRPNIRSIEGKTQMISKINEGKQRSLQFFVGKDKNRTRKVIKLDFFHNVFLMKVLVDSMLSEKYETFPRTKRRAKVLP